MLHMQVDCKFAGERDEVYLPHLHLRQWVLISLLCLIHVIDGQVIEQLKMPGKALEKIQMEPLLFLQEQLGSVMM